LKFLSGRYRQAWVKNVVGVGNAAGFVEPLGATALSMICREARRLVETLRQSDSQPGAASIRMYNAMSQRSWESIRDFLSIHYRFNTRLDTPFWRACRADVEIGGAAELVDYYHEEGPNEWGLNLTQLSMPPFGFLPDAYYCVLLGQRVPYRRMVAPSETEARYLAELRAHHAAMAARAFSPEQGIEILRHPYPGWDSASFAKMLI
jgi:tryptophan halogenase